MSSAREAAELRRQRILGLRGKRLGVAEDEALAKPAVTPMETVAPSSLRDRIGRDDGRRRSQHRRTVLSTLMMAVLGFVFGTWWTIDALEQGIWAYVVAIEAIVRGPALLRGSTRTKPEAGWERYAALVDTCLGAYSVLMAIMVDCSVLCFTFVLASSMNSVNPIE